MDSAALTSLTPLLDDIDRWVELVPLLPVIISLELILSADNAVALASITKRLPTQELQNKALNIGITISLFLRLLLIIFSQFLLKYVFIQLICGFYLIFLSFKNLSNNLKDDSDIDQRLQQNSRDPSLIKIILLLSITDLAFSIDSITAAVAISDQILLVLTGAIIGVVALRLTSSLFVKWLEIFSRLEIAGYIAIGLVGIKLILEIFLPNIIVPEYIVFLSMTILLTWGFSRKNYFPG